MNVETPYWLPHEAVSAAREGLLGKVRFSGLWLAGRASALRGRAVAVVGSRAPSDAGRARARAVGRDLARAGICVVSGLALGIDAAAHEGALDAGGITVGVLGGGHRCFFPRRNRGLAERMVAASGAVLSPFAPDHPAHPPQFLQRNGVIAALADAVVVIEAAARSGSLNTASWAASRSVPVFAIPGDVDRAKTAGCNALIRDGATLVRDAADVIADLGWGSPSGDAAARGAQTPVPQAFPDGVDAALARRVVEVLASDGIALEDLVASFEYAEPNIAAILATLALLELHGIVRRGDDGRYALMSNGAVR